MEYEAIESFSGVISMSKGDVREIPNKSLAEDLMKAKLIKKATSNDAKKIKKELEEAKETITNLQEENAILKTSLEEIQNDEENVSDNSDEGNKDPNKK